MNRIYMFTFNCRFVGDPILKAIGEYENHPSILRIKLNEEKRFAFFFQIR